MQWDLPIIAAAVLGVAGVSRLLTGTPVTPAAVFVLIGVVVGPLVAGEVSLTSTSSSVRVLAEATLAVVLFSDASRIKLNALRHEYAVPARLLGIGLPLTIAAGVGVAAVLFHQVNGAEMVVLAVVLAPTDAALGQAVVTEPRIPSRIRQGLNVESGLNDGICVPLLLIALAAADVEDKTATSHHAVKVLIEQIGYGLAGGVLAGLLASTIVAVAGRRHLITGSWLQVIPLAATGLAYGLATALDGSGFIASFVAGALFGRLVTRDSEEASRLSEEAGALLGGVTFLIFGAVLLGPALKHVSWEIALYSVLSLTLVRIVPVAVAMLGTGARKPTVSFLGWFGPRGLASIVFAVIVVEEAHLTAAPTILRATYITIGLSVFAHGATAAPLARRYAHWYESHPVDARPAMESVPASEHRPRGHKPSPADVTRDRSEGQPPSHVPVG